MENLKEITTQEQLEKAIEKELNTIQETVEALNFCD